MRRHLEVRREFNPQNDYIPGLGWIAHNSCDLYTFWKGRISFQVNASGVTRISVS